MQSWLKCTQREVGNSLQIVFRSPLPESKLLSSPSGKQDGRIPCCMNTCIEKASESKIRFHSKAERFLPSRPFPMSSDAFYEEYGYLENAPERSDRPSHRVKEAGQEVVERKILDIDTLLSKLLAATAGGAVFEELRNHGPRKQLVRGETVCLY
jgi:hypothetical protein